MIVTIEEGREYRIRGKRGKYAAVAPIEQDGITAGWWMRGYDGMHAFRNERIKKGRK
jgi:hypothetical protein